ncbi:194_t:CDS:10 [Diversispora eburnea]|uniref:194_t:CDS:1 n=1 Tax=Diversispora eburnea TaxID=1213867 RepID=A0A9N8ZDH7_9GLOM|nr:194_t:CDS:10 [Diversispora eburnea]
MATTIHLSSQQAMPQLPQHQHVQNQSARNRPISTPVPMNFPRYSEIPQQQHHHHHPQIPQSSVRRGNMFGPYLLLQTLGEGEFGKVKLGMHVAIKLIRKESVDTPSRLTKIEREIGVLRSVMHPNIVKLFDVFETDRYIGIIMEYASAHRYLKERDACKLFAQLISGVNYLHQKNIVHRDLKLENLLLDRNRNIIITDFGFANQFNGVHDDLMATSCGSPCYAAPELVISEGLYVGSAVDIWSCGYLPFDDDPQNPEGDNINLLYKYIINTPLVFPEYVSSDARDLLRKMLVPDPTKRCDMQTIMSHRWIAQYASIFDFGSSSNNYLTTDYIGEQQSDMGPRTATTVKRHTIQVEYEQPDNTAGYIDYPDEDFQFVDGTRLGPSLVPAVTSDNILTEEKDEISLNDYDNEISQNFDSTSTQNFDSQNLNLPNVKKHHSTSSTISGNSLDKISSSSSSHYKNSTNIGSNLLTLHENGASNVNPEKNQINNVHNRTRPITVHGPPSKNNLNLNININERKKRNNSKRKTISEMVESFKGPAAHSTHSVVTSSNVTNKDKRKLLGSTSTGSSNAAKKVMDWFRRKSLAKQDTPVLVQPVSSKIEEEFNIQRPKNKSKRQRNNPSQTLVSMGIEIKREGEFKVRCVRRKRRIIENDTLTILENSDTVVDILAEKKRKKYSSGPLKMLLRRSNSGEEIRFAVELCRIKNLPGIYIVDIKRMKGNLWAYKFLYHTLLDKLDLKGKGGYLTIGTSGGMMP